MNKAELVSEIAESMGGVTKKDADVALGAVLGAIKRGTVASGKIRIPGFGTFSIKQVPAGKVKNPANGEMIEYGPSAKLVFKQEKNLI